MLHLCVVRLEVSNRLAAVYSCEIPVPLESIDAGTAFICTSAARARGKQATSLKDLTSSVLKKMYAQCLLSIVQAYRNSDKVAHLLSTALLQSEGGSSLCTIQPLRRHSVVEWHQNCINGWEQFLNSLTEVSQLRFVV